MIILGTPSISIAIGLTGWLALISLVAGILAIYFFLKWKKTAALLDELSEQHSFNDSVVE